MTALNQLPGDGLGASAPVGFPGGTAVSHLRVYDWPTEDGLAGGSPHLHTASAEGYVVLRGEGSLETLSSAGFRETPLVPGTLLWFTPGTVHRLVNRSGDLELVVVMQNAGLPEAGDAILTYPPRVLADPDEYQRATAIPAAADFPDAATAHAAMSRAARHRRDLAIEGYLALRDRVSAEGGRGLAEMHAAAVRLVRDKAAGWHHHWERGPLGQANATGRHLDDLAQGQGSHLSEATVYTAESPPGPLRNGMCGLLKVWDLDGARPIG
ncbi:mannose-6-phosphate isomerase-like protein (cupin superfamily) [Lipingzhangella halophila]|uniref:Mannose-6-phosphate isomerase-like protein (Cupin superfamily) n=1 Tax=Lipingzhangella halophila TaxID=1783352 RepID=A0A7W7W648_9ACTN|nr:cupin domain-containing protein [Lipingzhangella halophila]MBB4934544.1 mannose-6-phosphate isomerase-like protein (cupin superfamily) [Lipingzhangella halophila]